MRTRYRTYRRRRCSRSKTAYVERGSPWEKGSLESFTAHLRDEPLNGEVFHTLREDIIESWRRDYNTIRPHASIGYKPPSSLIPGAMHRLVDPAERHGEFIF